MIYVNDFKVGDTVVLRNGATATVEEISEYKKGFGLRLSCFPGKMLGCYSHGRQKNFEESKYDIVQHIPAEEDNMVDLSKIEVGDIIVSRDETRMIVLDLRVEKGPHTDGSTTIKSKVIGHVCPGHGMVKRNHFGGGSYAKNPNGLEHKHEYDIVEHIPNQEVNLFEAEVGDTVIHKNGSKGTIKEIMKVGFLSGYDIALDVDHEDGRNTRLNYMRTGGGSKHGPSECIVHVVKPVTEPVEEELEKDRIFINGKWYVEE